jgi:hypothetical protein
MKRVKEGTVHIHLGKCKCIPSEGYSVSALQSCLEYFQLNIRLHKDTLIQSGTHKV